MCFKSFYYLCMRSNRMLSIMAGWQRLSEQVIIDKSLSGLQHLKFLIFRLKHAIMVCLNIMAFN